MTAALSALAALAVVGGASAGAVERVRVADGGTPETRGFPAHVFLTLESPPDYVATTPGAWAGPPFWPAANPAERGTAAIDWSVNFRDRTLDVQRAAAAGSANGWPQDQKGEMSIPLFAGGRQIGTLPGYFVLAASRARFEAALAVPLGASVQAIVRFVLREPSADSSEWGDYLVLESFLASTWNRGQALLAMSGVRVDGALPPARVSASAAPRRRAVTGRVVDTFANPVAGAIVLLERSTGSGWALVRATRATAQGMYALRATKRGRYRIAASLGGVTVRTRTIAVR